MSKPMNQIKWAEDVVERFDSILKEQATVGGIALTHNFFEIYNLAKAILEDNQ